MVTKEVEKALNGVAEKFGLAVKVGTRRFGTKDMRFPVEFVITEVDKDSGEMLSPEAMAYKKLAGSFGLDSEWLGAEFETYQGRYKIVGLKPRNRKYPVLADDVRTGKKYKFPVSPVKMWFANHPISEAA